MEGNSKKEHRALLNQGEEDELLRCIQVQKIRYVWDHLEKRFQKVGLLEDSNSCYDIHHTFGLGLSSEEQEVRRLVCGPNAIEVEIQPIWKLLVKQQSVKLHRLVEDHNKVQVTIMVKDKGKLSLPCDAVLIDGSCVVNEGMLTGESIPVTKTPLPHVENTMPWKSHSLEDYRKHVLFCGTEVIQVKPSGQGPVRAVVLQTG
ncbi:Putative cation-transporting ATPase 13A5 [Heterocephalus glaber]|uniref:Putative cation-transporting ATPase 13A5 n=1 Tax=Heterocephalus glaber TaxID=10181 RepID=G5BXF0_HETGA|nr:Putative cation-transporting ATPase 13A5 [Heterocephalus glaber]